MGIEEVSEFVASLRENVRGGGYQVLKTPREEIYPVRDDAIARRLQASDGEA